MLIREFQDMMHAIYFWRDSDRGAAETYSWLQEEVDELGVAIQQGDKKAMAEEFADVLAWLASLANVLGIDLGAATLDKYARCCPKCRSSPCVCPFERH